MISLIWSMTRARLGRAAITFALAALAAAAAAAGPIYLQAATVSARSVEVLAQSPSDRSLGGAILVGGRTSPDSKLDGSDLTEPAGATVVSGAMVTGSVEGPAAVQQVGAAWEEVTAAWRSGECDHLEMVSGRCVSTDREVVLREDAAKAIGVAPGDDLTFALQQGPGDSSGGPPTQLTVVGLYAPVNPHDLFWAAATTCWRRIARSRS